MSTHAILTADVFGSLGNLNVQQFLNGQRIALLTTHHRNVVQSVKIWQALSHAKNNHCHSQYVHLLTVKLTEQLVHLYKFRYKTYLRYV